MNKPSLLLAVAVGASVVFAGCSLPSKMNSPSVPAQQSSKLSSQTDLASLTGDAQQLDNEVQQDPLAESEMNTDSKMAPKSETSNAENLEKDLGNLKLEDERFQ